MQDRLTNARGRRTTAASMLKPIHALVGGDLFLQLDTLAGLIRSAPPDAQRADFNGEDAELGVVLDELRSFAMFSSFKLVVMRSADEFITRYREQLEQYTENPSTSATLVLRLNSLPKGQRIYKRILAMGQIHDCEAPKEVSGWIVKRAKEAHKLVVKPDAARALADYIGNDLGRIDNELAKLALSVEGGVVDAGMISVSVVFQREQEMWNMTDEVAAGHTREAMKRWRQLTQLDSSAEFRAVTWLTIWLEKSRKALAMKRAKRSDFDIGRELKIWPGEKVAPFMKTAIALGEGGVNRLIDLLAELDHRSKSGKGEMAENVERFLLEAGRK
jgi:DNA polymerase-3 subunit delta